MTVGADRMGESREYIPASLLISCICGIQTIISLTHRLPIDRKNILIIVIIKAIIIITNSNASRNNLRKRLIFNDILLTMEFTN